MLSKFDKTVIIIEKNPVINQDLEPFLEKILNNLDDVKGGFKGSPKFPNFVVFDTLIHFYKRPKKVYLKHTKKLIKNLCSGGIYDHVEGGISRYTVDENWLIPHFEKMLYDNAQFISLLSNFCLEERDDYFLKKIEHTISFINKNFINKENNLLGSAMDADSEEKKVNIMCLTTMKLKNKRYFKIFRYKS